MEQGQRQWMRKMMGKKRNNDKEEEKAKGRKDSGRRDGR